MRFPIRLPVLLVVALAASACGLIYRQDVNQGNLVEQESVDLLKPGMTKRQVALIMGTPSIESPFDQDRWDYASSFSRRGKDPEVKNLTLVFEAGALLRIEGDYFPQRNEEMLESSRQIKGKVDDDLDAATRKADPEAAPGPASEIGIEQEPEAESAPQSEPPSEPRESEG